MDFLNKILDKLEQWGFRPRKLRWKLYQWEKRREAARDRDSNLPTRFQWLRYPHKFCLKCNALNDREAKRCKSCGARLPSPLAYKLFRLAGIVTPQGGAPTIVIFMVAIVALFVLSIPLEGLSVILSPSPEALERFGSWAPEMLYEAPLRRYSSPYALHKSLRYWRILAFGLVHAGIIHIGFNLFALSQIGPLMENQIGRARMLVLITVCQLTAAVGAFLWYDLVTGRAYVFTVGASGWLFGLIGFGIAYFHTGGPAMRVYRDVLVRWAVYALVFGFLMAGRVNNAAHVGGLVGGLIMGVIPEAHPRRNKVLKYFWTGGFWVCLALWLITGAFLAWSIAAEAPDLTVGR
jgi:membrane associated rhomboid family serine protease